MKKETKNLKIYSVLFVVFAIVEVLMLVGEFLSGKFDTQRIVEQTQADAKLVEITVGLVVAISVVTVFAFLIMGVLGLRQVNGNYNGRIHVVVAIIFVVIEAITILLYISQIVKGTESISICTPALIKLCFLFPYIKDAKSLRK